LFLHSLPSVGDPHISALETSIIIAVPSPLRQLMKFDFKIKTEPTLCALVAIAIVAFGSDSLASIAIALGDPLTGQFCALVLMAIVFLALRSLHGPGR
jgi:hypothetical protein